MKDPFFVVVAVFIVLALAGGVFIVTRDRQPWTIVGAPAGAKCGYADGRGVRTCVAGGIAYTCVNDWNDHTITCGERAQTR